MSFLKINEFPRSYKLQAPLITKKICKADLGQEVLFNEMHVCSRNKINDAGFILFILLLTGFFLYTTMKYLGIMHMVIHMSKKNL